MSLPCDRLSFPALVLGKSSTTTIGRDQIITTTSLNNPEQVHIAQNAHRPANPLTNPLRAEHILTIGRWPFAACSRAEKWRDGAI